MSSSLPSSPTTELKLVGKGSAKDLYEIDGEHLALVFSDRVSVFDYGALPEIIPGRGEFLKRSALAFEKLWNANDIATAFAPELSLKTGHFVQKKVAHPKFPSPGDEKFSLKFIPLEIIFRWGVVPASSLLRRNPKLKAYDRFSEPMVEFSTKLEMADRMLDSQEAILLAGGEERFKSLEAFAKNIARLLNTHFETMGLELWDGKIECAFNALTGKIFMVDALTPDELRVTLPEHRDISLSKELLRLWLGGTSWSWEIGRQKKINSKTWREKIAAPPKLGPWRISQIASLYEAFALSLESQSSAALLNWIAGKSALQPKVFVKGGGGRESALRWRLSLEGALITETEAHADAILISQDADLAAGAIDDLLKRGLWAVGPSQNAAQLEWSKRFGREIAALAKIRIPKFSTDAKDLKTFAHPPVIKFDGLAAGKGVVVPNSWPEAEQAVESLGAKGALVLEERLRGFEASAFFAVESGYYGQRLSFLGSARDFKRRFAGDEGPNTGGMGAYSPHPEVNEQDIELWTHWARQTVEVLASRGVPYQGVLYLGLLKDEKTGWNLLEYNARPGDPETQALVVSWPAEQKILRQLLQLDVQALPSTVSWSEKALCVSLVRPEYPDAPKNPPKLPSWELAKTNVQLFLSQSQTGRVGYVVGRAPTLMEAGDLVFGALTESPWKELLEWRADLL